MVYARKYMIANSVKHAHPDNSRRCNTDAGSHKTQEQRATVTMRAPSDGHDIPDRGVDAANTFSSSK